MATSEEYLTFVCEQIARFGAVRYRKMFGDAMVYLDDKPILLVCDNTVFVKCLPETAALLSDAGTGTPYDGARPHYMLDIDNARCSTCSSPCLRRVPRCQSRERKRSKPDPMPRKCAASALVKTGASQRMPRSFHAFGFSFPSGSAACPRADTP